MTSARFTERRPDNTQGLHPMAPRGLLEQVMHHGTMAMALVDANGKVLEGNPALCQLLGLPAETLNQLHLEDLLHPSDRSETLQLLNELQQGSTRAVQQKLRVRHADQRTIWAQAWLAWLEANPENLLLMQLVDISTIQTTQRALAERREQLERALHTDSLTGLPGRSTVLKDLSQQASGALLSVGIDRLSEVNHALTHRAGDQLIQAVAHRLKEAMGGVRGIARGTGDTFIVCADHLHTIDEARALAERLRLACKGPIQFESSTINTSVSVGVARWEQGLCGEEVLRDAVIAMRQAAANGRDRCVVAEAEMGAEARQTLALQEQLHLAIQNGELQVWFMPLVELGSGCVSGYEALVRWHRSDGRIEPPDAFLPAARKGLLATQIDLLLLGQALEAMAALPPSVTVAVNLTPTTLGDPALVEQVCMGLKQHGLAPERLHLEITETALLNRSHEIDSAIQRLAALGVRWMVDDFGTGYSSISNLRDLPIHGLKLDRSFTEGIRQGDQKSLRLAQALAGLGEGLGLITVAEGIERPEEAATLQDLGWQLGQGYFYGAPAPLSHWQQGNQPPVTEREPLQPVSRSNWALAVTDNVPVGLFAVRWIPERPVEVVFASRRCLELLQLSPEQIPTHLEQAWRRIQPEDRAHFQTRWEQCALQRRSFSWEGRLHIDSGVRWLRIEAVPIPQVDGSLIWQGVMGDITPQKQQELHLRQILTEAPIPIVIQKLGEPTDRTSFINRPFEQCFGYSLAEIPNREAWFRRAFPDEATRNELLSEWETAVIQALAGDGVIPAREVVVTTASGDVRDALFSGVVVGDEIVISAVDLTPWRQAERELSMARSALAETALAITEAIPVGTYTMVLPPDGGMARFSFMSERFLEICGLNREEAAADPLKAFACVHPDDYDAWVKLNADTFARKVPFHGECRVVVHGEVKWIVAESVPRSLSDGSTVWEGVLTDVTPYKQMLQQIKSERTLLNTVLNHIDGHVYMKDRDGRYLYANPPVQKLFQNNGMSIVGCSDAELMPASTAATIRAFDETVFRDGGPLTQEETFIDSQGQEHIFLSQKLVFREPDKPDCLIGFSTEISALRQATAELAASEEHFRLLAENVSDVVFRLSEEGTILWVSPSLTPNLGWDPHDWIGEVGTQFLVHGGQTDHYQANLQALQAGVVPPLAREQVYAKDGSTHWVETQASPYRNAQGEVKGIVASFRVIDSIVAGEEELRIREERYRLLAENARDVIWTMEPDGRISYVSPSIHTLRGYTPEEAMAQSLEEIHPPESIAISQGYFENLLSDVETGREPQPFRGELEYYCRNGSTIWAEVIALPRLHHEGRLVKLLGVSRDITERKRFEQQLTAANRQLEALAITDTLTGIGNRRHLETMIRDAMDRADRYGDALSLILCDIDFFKAINDNFGHQTGDQVLIEFSQRVQQHLRRSDGFGRWGGEEFIILLPSSGSAAARALAEELRQVVAGEPFADVGPMTASFGVAQRHPYETEASWFRRVDEFLYAAKQNGRNRVSGDGEPGSHKKAPA